MRKRKFVIDDNLMQNDINEISSNKSQRNRPTEQDRLITNYLIRAYNRSENATNLVIYQLFLSLHFLLPQFVQRSLVITA